MSWMKWTLALAGTAMGLRYLGGRRHERLAPAGGTPLPTSFARDAGAARREGSSGGPPGQLTGSAMTGPVGTGPVTEAPRQVDLRDAESDA